MLFDEIPPDTSSYMVAGYVIFFAITLIYVASLLIRQRNLDRDLLTLENLEEEREAAETAKPAGVKRTPSRAKSGNAKATKKKTARKK